MPASPGGGHPPTIHLPDEDPTQNAHEIPIPDAEMEVAEHLAPFAPSSSLAFGDVPMDADLDVVMNPSTPIDVPAVDDDVVMHPTNVPEAAPAPILTTPTPSLAAASTRTSTPVTSSAAPSPVVSLLPPAPPLPLSPQLKRRHTKSPAPPAVSSPTPALPAPPLLGGL